MSEINERLSQCFSTVFPELPADQYSDLAAETYDRWDSLATVKLVAVIEEEFGVSVTPDDIPDLVSYERMSAMLERKI